MQLFVLFEEMIKTKNQPAVYKPTIFLLFSLFFERKINWNQLTHLGLKHSNFAYFSKFGYPYSLISGKRSLNLLYTVLRPS